MTRLVTPRGVSQRPRPQEGSVTSLSIVLFFFSLYSLCFVTFFSLDFSLVTDLILDGGSNVVTREGRERRGVDVIMRFRKSLSSRWLPF